ncbi:DNA-deoxyinosine glycosylase [Undibacterium flavidum]|uniref:DNA-deoxyinosine glycosylase n=1 Tax=Undibacterium flavidum TaxID=2762297 RepID=A0ABR6Y783_9BURK|nr:DNA-deoxyinosine glycosylase [Undibacterium flavidum]MBC3872457.1 DNA-deoxyinosine glycosylase [Undibacterium flavidum]
MPSKHSFAPIVDNNTRLLILGSLPGDASLALQQYYAHPQNRFWHLLSDVLQFDLLALDYPSRLQSLLTHHVGLWDVIAQAQRKGSLDSQIRDRTNNDLLALINTLPQLQAIAFNGATAAKIGHKLLDGQADRYHLLALPSSSPAYTLAYPLKRDAWLHLRDSL